MLVDTNSISHDFDINIYEIVCEKEYINQVAFCKYEVMLHHFSRIEDLLDFGRIIRYNSKAENKQLFIEDELAAYKQAYSLNNKAREQFLKELNNEEFYE